ncbi:phosphoribosylglycinamide formyltransferase-1 [Clostridium tetanomorphum]|nr:phosphoribosylglycinamide formyltransferase [Clostridium tetanomorphum]KAJ50579.1 phosphoribosylglycinamide formyltransferase [Clostridium tetanomorphum DSM 665]MBP1862653.1 phosphoribosylglycinamide formyltransferase-1 [Clostridium tetanomorphum]NRS85506.1 phosphoribosylglycinamide formyltransferase-1 [Clostridium tetanomorphum]NRZ98620.1 phosphoribosylglycinamide formyltransferase-1 [Clostridium tetanomorphum]SQC02775.1 folate-dependent phosphoribosylglycinamide formyltransferase PurN [Cl
MKDIFKIAVLVSGGGTNLQSIIDSINSGYLNCSIEMVISDRKDVYALKRAKDNNIKTYVLERNIYKESISDEILKIIEGKVDIIVLAGWLSHLKGNIIDTFQNRIINIHPSLIPSFSGKGMYGIKVHEKAVEYGVKISGCTVHIVDSGMDTGPIILQRAVPVLPEDTAESLQKRVLLEEHVALPEAIKYFIENKIEIINRKVIINS